MVSNEDGESTIPCSVPVDITTDYPLSRLFARRHHGGSLVGPIVARIAEVAFK
jgi:hypothetical protein